MSCRLIELRLKPSWYYIFRKGQLITKKLDPLFSFSKSFAGFPLIVVPSFPFFPKILLVYPNFIQVFLVFQVFRIEKRIKACNCNFLWFFRNWDESWTFHTVIVTFEPFVMLVRLITWLRTGIEPENVA